MKKQNIIIIAVFGLLIVSLGLLSWLTPDADFSENDNRVLQQLPRLTADTVKSGDFGDEVEDYQDLHEHYGYCRSAIGYRLFEGARTIMTAREARRRETTR